MPGLELRCRGNNPLAVFDGMGHSRFQDDATPRGGLLGALKPLPIAHQPLWARFSRAGKTSH